MTLKSIELIGFKSFGKKSLVSFPTPITAIVGPNGSGKSNIVEAIRFVLGEQSMKSLRGKGGVDLIFKGSKTLSSSSRALVTITFDNRKKIFSFTNSGLGISLDYDEISISREVIKDGGNVYSINGSLVRLKDVIDLLSSVNIGNSGHHIISQGEADRVLSASNKDRRLMIEDALGLKVYQYRIRESEHKLDKTHLNMKEAQALRREIAPHLTFLKKQVQIVEKARAMREELREFYKTYLSFEATYIKIETHRIGVAHHSEEKQLASINEQINIIKLSKEDVGESQDSLKIKEYDVQLGQLRSKKDELSHSLGRIEGIIEGLEREMTRIPEKEERVILESEWRGIVALIEEDIDRALVSESISQIADILSAMKKRLSGLHLQAHNSPKVINEAITKEFSEMNKTRDDINSQLKEIIKNEEHLEIQISSLREQEKELESSIRDSERKLYELLGDKNKISSNLQALKFEEEKLGFIKNSFELEMTEAGVFIGHEAISYSHLEASSPIIRTDQDELHRKIERIKIKLEDMGSGNGSEMMKEYEETEERDRFLAKEIDDLGKSLESVRLLIIELKETLDIEFKTGVEKINKQFQVFFALMFGGGSAFLSIVMEHKKIKNLSSEDELDELDEDDEEKENYISENENGANLIFERGIEINVTLPHKKVKDLHMLSGGERSLASIALLFAISQVNPPPFLVLDETDAALDEANSRKYGNMLENLAKYSQLIVVTHNRETMSRANVLYGVTMDLSGVSKFLSIHLEDADAYAK